MLDVINIVIPAIIGLLGVFLGSWLNSKSSIKLQKDFFKREIKIYKLQDVSYDLADMIREAYIPMSILDKKINNELDNLKIREKRVENQERMLRLYRGIRIKAIFLNEEYKRNIEQFYDKYLRISDKMYEIFYEPQKRHYKNDELTYEAIEADIVDCTMFGYKLLEQLNLELKKELENLK